MKTTKVIDENKIKNILNETKKPSPEVILNIIKKAKKKKGLNLKDAAYLLNADDPLLIDKIFAAASKIKHEIYGDRLVFFAPLYVSNFCVNDCAYCGFHVSNPAPRKKLTLKEVAEQVKFLEDMGHKRLLLELGEEPELNNIDYVVEVIKTIYATRSGKGEIRRININIAATTVENYKKLHNCGIGTYQLFQETYHRPTYKKMHKGPKADYERQLHAHDNAFKAGIDDVGLGVLFGLYDYRFEVLGLISHAEYLEKKFGIGPHTISVPRMQPAESVKIDPPHPIDENTLLKIIAILRLSVPYTGLIISTRESAATRAKAFKAGITQASAASRTSPGGYKQKEQVEQFKCTDSRGVGEVLNSIIDQGYLPSFCTACYRRGRTGASFMDLAKPGDIQNFCQANAILTFKEYLEDYADSKNKAKGHKIIRKHLKKIPDKKIKEKTIERLGKIECGERDLYF